MHTEKFAVRRSSISSSCNDFQIHIFKDVNRFPKDREDLISCCTISDKSCKTEGEGIDNTFYKEDKNMCSKLLNIFKSGIICINVTKINKTN